MATGIGRKSGRLFQENWRIIVNQVKFVLEEIGTVMLRRLGTLFGRRLGTVMLGDWVRYSGGDWVRLFG